MIQFFLKLIIAIVLLVIAVLIIAFIDNTFFHIVSLILGVISGILIHQWEYEFPL